MPKKPVSISETISQTMNPVTLRQWGAAGFLRGYFLNIWVPTFNNVLNNEAWKNFVSKRYLKGSSEPYVFIVRFSNPAMAAEMKWYKENLLESINERMKGQFLRDIRFY